MRAIRKNNKLLLENVNENENVDFLELWVTVEFLPQNLYLYFNRYLQDYKSFRNLYRHSL